MKHADYTTAIGVLSTSYDSTFIATVADLKEHIGDGCAFDEPTAVLLRPVHW